MKLSHALAAVLANLAALFAADYFVSNVQLTGTLADAALVALALTALNWILKPALKLIFGPVIVVTFGLATVAVNALILYLVDILFKSLTIYGIAPLIYTTLIVSAANMLTHAFTRNK